MVHDCHIREPPPFNDKRLSVDRIFSKHPCSRADGTAIPSDYDPPSCSSRRRVPCQPFGKFRIPSYRIDNRKDRGGPPRGEPNSGSQLSPIQSLPTCFLKTSFFVLPRLDFRTSLRAPTAHLPMSKHNSLKSNATVGGKRSVLKRFERVKLLKERGEWKQGKSPIGLPKTKHEG